MRRNEEYLGWTAEKLARKANQEWEMADLARQDGDKADAKQHTNLAIQYEERLKELRKKTIPPVCTLCKKPGHHALLCPAWVD